MAFDTPILVIADVHANEAALQAVMRHARTTYHRYDQLRIWFLGDLFGRGPDPVRTWVRFGTYNPEAIVVGNHDWRLISNLPDVGDPNYGSDDLAALRIQQQDLATVDLLTLDAAGQPTGGGVSEAIKQWAQLAEPLPGVYLIHGGAQVVPDDTTPDSAILTNMIIDGYIETAAMAANTLTTVAMLARRGLPVGGTMLPPSLVLIGHYHHRVLYRSAYVEPWEPEVVLDQPYVLDASADCPVLLSPGSVGFPRDIEARNPSYAVLHLTDGRPTSVTFHAVSYDREPVQAVMRERGYPPSLIARL